MKRTTLLLLALAFALPAWANELCLTVHHAATGRSETSCQPNLRTNVGADFFAAQLFGTPGAAAIYVGLSSNSTAPAATDTVLAGEISNANGLGRAIASVGHTAGSTSSVLSKTWTYTGSVSVTINKVALFNAGAAGAMTHEAAVISAPTVTSPGDTLTINYTMNYTTQ